MRPHGYRWCFKALLDAQRSGATLPHLPAGNVTFKVAWLEAGWSRHKGSQSRRPTQLVALWY
eukprot:414811-Amphidinium_carterae.1